METAPARNTNGPTVVARLSIVPSGATSSTGSRRCGKLEEKLTSEIAEATPSVSPARTAIHTTGRHRGDGGRPSGNSSGTRKKNGAVTPRDTVKIQPAQAAPGSPAAGVRAAYVLAATLSAVTVAPARKNQPRRLPARTVISAPTSANESVAGMKPNTPVQVTPPVRPSTTFAASSRTVRASSVQASPFSSRCDMSPSRAPMATRKARLRRQRYGNVTAGAACGA